MRIWIVYHYEDERGLTEPRRFSIDRDVKSSAELEVIYRFASEWCKERNKELIHGKWAWKVEIGENQEGGIDAMLLFVIFEMVEDVLRIWREEEKNVFPFE